MNESPSVLTEPVVKTESKQVIKIVPTFCPVCGVETMQAECIEGKNKDRSIWYACQCGVWFQDHFPESTAVYDEKYIINLAESKDAKERYNYLLRLYAPLIEELTYGRMMLEVGFAVPYLLESMSKRGWLTWAIDVNPTLTGQGNIYKGDFLDYDFSLSNPAVTAATGEEKIERKFDLIWMGHVLEHMRDPIAALKKAYDLLEGKGVLFIATPDIDFIYKTTVCGWGHFKPDEHYIMWSERALVRELERIGFKIVMKRRNYSSRFMSWYDVQIIAQKNYF
jgi:2-polyprenyl-3-methyl-5-hydroxy-6-metoxy-1,4-benzoquinol methylase